MTEPSDKKPDFHNCIDIKKTKTHAKKLRLDLLPIRAVEEVARAFQWGVEGEGYPEWDWLTVEEWQDMFFGAALRHLFEWRKGVTKDAKSGLHPLAHAGACVLILLTRSGGTNDKPGKS